MLPIMLFSIFLCSFGTASGSQRMVAMSINSGDANATALRNNGSNSTTSNFSMRLVNSSQNAGSFDRNNVAAGVQQELNGTTSGRYSTEGSTKDLEKAALNFRLIKFGSIIGSCVFLLLILGIAAILKRNLTSDGASGTAASADTSPPDDEMVAEAMAKERMLAEKNQGIHRIRGRVLSVLFLLYVSVSVGVPLLKRKSVSCSNGFFWEDHMYFLSVFFVTKLVEICLLAFDGSIVGDVSLWEFFLKFAPSMLGFADGYTDATAIAIAASCESDISHTLAVTMLTSYVAGVLLLQWVAIGIMACRDDTHICLMKLLHMDTVSSCMSLPPEQEWTWKGINFARTLGEDVPQAIQQTLFLIYVKKNPFMILSVLVSVASSTKALWDALYRSRLAKGAYEKLMAEGGAEDARLVSFSAGLQKAVHGLLFTFSDGSRTGKVFKNGEKPVDLYNLDDIRSRCSNVTEQVNEGEEVVAVSGHNCTKGYVCHRFVLELNSGRKIEATGNRDEWKGQSFRFEVTPGRRFRDAKYGGLGQIIGIEEE
eukprot:TRINITY_DN13019_c0_g2_i1.p1 TRINITY_DN13019_c0_g2~~TRINITY_DN13019_c0_g2_i1.p1  ORF type:complete len:538 (-),score=73.62 TRINITY_DN13019_c0_g2_i1:40-1653(-)